MQIIPTSRGVMAADALACPDHAVAMPVVSYVKPAIPRAQARRLRQMAQGTLTARNGCPCLPGGALYNAFANVPAAF